MPSESTCGCTSYMITGYRITCGNVLRKIKVMSNSKKIAPNGKVDLELLYHRLGHRSTISLMSGFTSNVWKDIELRIDPHPFCTSCQISSMNKS